MTSLIKLCVFTLPLILSKLLKYLNVLIHPREAPSAYSKGAKRRMEFWKQYKTKQNYHLDTIGLFMLVKGALILQRFCAWRVVSNRLLNCSQAWVIIHCLSIFKIREDKPCRSLRTVSSCSLHRNHSFPSNNLVRFPHRQNTIIRDVF